MSTSKRIATRTWVLVAAVYVGLALIAYGWTWRGLYRDAIQASAGPYERAYATVAQISSSGFSPHRKFNFTLGGVNRSFVAFEDFSARTDLDSMMQTGRTFLIVFDPSTNIVLQIEDSQLGKFATDDSLRRFQRTTEANYAIAWISLVAGALLASLPFYLSFLEGLFRKRSKNK